MAPPCRFLSGFLTCIFPGNLYSPFLIQQEPKLLLSSGEVQKFPAMCGKDSLTMKKYPINYFHGILTED